MDYNKEGFTFRFKGNTITPICKCGEELYADYEKDGILECPKCHKKYNLKSFEENSRSLVRSLLKLFPNSPKLDPFWVFSQMVRTIKEWKKKAIYYDKIHQYTSNIVTDIIHNSLVETTEMENFKNDLMMSIYYENNEQNNEIKIF